MLNEVVTPGCYTSDRGMATRRRGAVAHRCRCSVPVALARAGERRREDDVEGAQRGPHERARNPSSGRRRQWLLLRHSRRGRGGATPSRPWRTRNPPPRRSTPASTRCAPGLRALRRRRPPFLELPRRHGCCLLARVRKRRQLNRDPRRDDRRSVPPTGCPSSPPCLHRRSREQSLQFSCNSLLLIQTNVQ